MDTSPLSSVQFVRAPPSVTVCALESILYISLPLPRSAGDTFTLYFADKSGKRLLKETRNVCYRRTLPKERVVLEQLAKGPLEDGHYATIPENTMAINVITADRICYLDLNSEFQDAALDVAENISVYSVVNSIVDSCEADKVQISIEGNSGGNFQKNLPLYKFYEKNKDLVIPDEDEES